MRYGRFDDQRREYVITRPDTPLPWINYLGCESFFGIISNSAGGYSFHQDARLRRLTRYRYNNAPLDMGGRYIYLREALAGQDQPRIWSPSWMPVRTALDSYECRHGLGYTTISASLAGLHSQVRYFIPLGDSLEIWELTLHNERSLPAEISVFSSVEFALWDALDDATNFQRNYSIGEVEVAGQVIYHKTEYRERRNHFAYFACSEALAGFDTDRESFLGPWRGWELPRAVEEGRLSGSLAHGWQPVGAMHVPVTLLAGEEKKIIFLLGYHENPPEEKFDPPGSQTINKRGVGPIIARYLQPAMVSHAFERLGGHWQTLLEKLQVHTPDLHTDRMVNIWNACQVMVTYNMSRSASYFESGVGRGMGFRDSNQDLLGFMHLDHERARQRLLDLAATQLPNGGAYHQYQPLTRRGNHEIGSDFNDDPLWLVLAVTAYVKESGDWSMINEMIPFDNKPGSEATLLVHLQRALGYTLERLGPHGLPLIGRADWNDCLNLNCFSETPGRSFQTTTNKNGRVAESVFIAGLFVLAAREMAALCQEGEQQVSGLMMGAPGAAGYQAQAKTMEQVIWEAGWDGSWFRRAYDDFGRVLGGQENEEGRIFIEPQGICIMAGLGVEDGRAEMALEAVADHLATPHGIILHQPAFSRYYLHLGEISSYPAGYKENAGIFCHTNPWIVIAEAKVGHGRRAHDYYLRINPSRREEMSEIHRCEPYVYAQMIAGRDAPTFGEAKNSWLTGTAAWNYVAITQWILGVRPEYAGLRIDPVIPPEWDGFDMVRHFRGCRYHITVHNPQHVSRGVVRLLLDGIEQPGSLAPLTAGLHHRVEVWLGDEASRNGETAEE